MYNEQQEASARAYLQEYYDYLAQELQRANEHTKAERLIQKMSDLKVALLRLSEYDVKVALKIYAPVCRKIRIVRAWSRHDKNLRP